MLGLGGGGKGHRRTDRSETFRLLLVDSLAGAPIRCSFALSSFPLPDLDKTLLYSWFGPTERPEPTVLSPARCQDNHSLPRAGPLGWCVDSIWGASLAEVAARSSDPLNAS
eukprot:scaffold256887_cov31-Tisochrysis_lutea.AAC.1